MTTRTGMAAKIIAYVAARPGCTRAQLLAGVGSTDKRDAMPTYCRNAKMIFAAGPRGRTRFYPTAELASAAHAGLVAHAARARDAVKTRAWANRNLRQRAARHAAGGRCLNTKPGRHTIDLAPGVTLAPDVRITIAPPMRDRWQA